MKTVSLRARRHHAGAIDDAAEMLAVEAPLQVRINGTAFSATMRTPGDDRVLVRGLLHSESIVADPAGPVELVERADPGSGIVLCVNAIVPAEFLTRDFAGRRALISTSSCGLCGVREADDIGAESQPLAPPRELLDPARIPAMIEAMQAGQEAFARSGGCHAAAAFDVRGGLLCAFEDVGRHNAVDKVVGRLIERRELGRAACLLVSGRVSYEIVAKAWRAGMHFVLAVSAPSSMAVEMAQRLGMTVIGFCRGDRATIYANSQYIAEPGAALAAADRMTDEFR